MNRFKSVILSTLLVLTCSLLSVQAYAIDEEPIDCWNSNVSYIGYYPGSISVGITTYNGLVFDDVDEYVEICEDSITNWTDIYEDSIETSSNPDYKLYMSDISREDITDLYGIPLTVVGATINVIDYVDSTGETSDGQTVYILALKYAKSYLIWDDTGSYDGSSSVKTSGYSQKKWESVATHEFGHALGYFGHDTECSSNDPAIMYTDADKYYDDWGVKAPTDRDTDHMDNVYY